VHSPDQSGIVPPITGMRSPRAAFLDLIDHLASLSLLDFLGAGLFFATGGWMLWTRVASGGSAAPGITLIATCGLVLFAARSFGAVARLLVPAACLVAAIWVVAASPTSVVSTHPLTGPFAYLNADGAFYVQACIAGLMLALTARSGPIRVVASAVATAFAVLPFVIHAVGAATLVLLLPGVALVSTALGGARGARVAVTVLGSMFAAALAATILLGATLSPGTTPSLLQRAAFSTVDAVRVSLWHDAYVIMRAHPGTGVGPGRYQWVSPIASRHRDARWAHNEFLQQGAEGGVAGLLLLAALFGWGFVRLWAVKAPDAMTSLGAASLAALGIHACIDYVMHFPAIPLMTTALVAVGMTGGIVRSSDRGRSPSVERHVLAQTRA
jgi:O-antigen ligase